MPPNAWTPIFKPTKNKIHDPRKYNYMYKHFVPQEEKWQNQEKEDRRINFLPQKFDNLRTVPGYPNFIRERFERCLDLYLCPRQRKMRVRSNSMP